jgi:hypothetical protein
VASKSCSKQSLGLLRVGELFALLLIESWSGR